MSHPAAGQSHAKATWRAVIIENSVTPVVAGLGAYLGFLHNHPGGVAAVFIGAVLDFPLYMVVVRVAARVAGGRATWLEQCYAFSHHHLPPIADIVITVFVFFPQLYHLSLGPQLLGVAILVAFVLTLLIWFILPVPALMESYGFSAGTSTGVVVIAGLIFGVAAYIVVSPILFIGGVAS